MNISESEASAIVVAKTCGCKEQQDGKKVTYAFIDSYHNICIDKKDIISSELDACEKLVRYTTDQTEKQVIERDIRIEDHVRPFTLIISVRLHISGNN